MAQTVERTGRMRSGERANTRGSFLVRAFTRLAVAGWIVWGVVAAGRAATSAGGLPYGWTPQLFAWPVELTAIVAAIGLVGTLLPAWFDRARGGAGREGSEPRIWRGLPGRWRENALVVRAHRSTWRLMVRMPALGFWLLGGVGLSLPWLTTLMRHNGLPRTGGSLALGILREISYFGRDLGHLFMVSPLEPHQSVLLAEIVLLTMVVAPIATVVAAGGAGRIVARERSSGSLGFLLLTDLTHREVAEGLLVGQLAPLIEMITVVSLTLLLWAISAGDLGILAIGSLAALLLWGLVLMASGLAFIAGARYARRADGAPEAMSMLLLVHGTAFIALRVTTESWPESFGWNWMLCAAAVWVVLSAWYGWLAWAACPGAVARLRRLTAIGQAFDQATRRD